MQLVGQLRYVIHPDGLLGNSLTEALRPGTVISIVGGGGKTSTMFTLGKELAEKGRMVTLTTTTKIRPFANAFPERMRCAGLLTEEGKLKGPENPVSLKKECDHLIIEADGSKGLPLKMPADHEPVIINESNQVIAVVGLSAVGKTIGEACHRPELVSSFLEKTMDGVLTPEDIAKIILSPKGLSKNRGRRDFVVILNQADTKEDIANGNKIRAILPESYLCVMTSYEPSQIDD